MELMPGYKHSDVGVIPDGWDVLPLGSLVRSVEYGSAAKSDVKGAVPVLRMGNLQGGKIDWSDLVFTDDIDEINKYMLQPGDVLFNRTNTIDLVGKTSIYEGGCPAIFAGYLIRINVAPDLLDSRFLNYILNTEFSRKYSAKVLSVAVGQANINGQKLKTYPIPLPPTKTEQEDIAQALSDADELLVVLDQMIAKKRDLKQAAMQQLLTGEKRLPGFSGDWELALFGDLFDFSGGYSASRDQLSNEGHCYLHYGDIHGSSKTSVNTSRDFLDIPKLSISLGRISEGSLLKHGDVVFVDASEDDAGTSKHLVIENEDDVPFISGLHTIVAKSKTNDLAHTYKHYCFQTSAIRQQFMFYAVGTKVSGISKTNIAKLTLPIPSIPEQIAIADVLSSMDVELAILEARRDKTRNIKQAMMQELLTGKTRLVKPRGPNA
jgi:type I restriction enzyme S subunit